jgi:hypothetical protein
MILWEAAVHEDGDSWPGSYVPNPNASAVKQLVADVQHANKSALAYMSMWFAFSRNASVYANHVREWRDEYGIDGIYSDGLPEDDFLVAYEEVRLLRELFPTGSLIFHDSQEGREEGKPTAFYRPVLHAYATSTLMGENTHTNSGVAWQWPRYATAQFRRSNAFGAIKAENSWYGPGISPPANVVNSDLVQLVYGGRDRPSHVNYSEYLSAKGLLEQVWQQHGAESPDTFYDQYYLPAAQNATGLLIGRSPMPLASVEHVDMDGVGKGRGTQGGVADTTPQVLVSLRTYGRTLRAGGAIRYTVDGTAVTESSQAYPAQALHMPEGTLLRATTFEMGLDRSRELSLVV